MTDEIKPLYSNHQEAQYIFFAVMGILTYAAIRQDNEATTETYLRDFVAEYKKRKKETPFC